MLEHSLNVLNVFSWHYMLYVNLLVRMLDLDILRILYFELIRLLK
jgi:hypothetical protein